ncbi:M67 family metallopeptidase [Candidatus Methylomirabilis sp.]|uniref:M67 family metallopeptidase n=1 Tax=Candidatus Methylomirabilis sp. TaxID=2032687 RepID=UPI002A680FFF|nr:M67 family metallopeptidase [Candidatus Methylomirabilis sp.]
MGLTQSELDDVFAHAEESYPDEACGIVIGKPGDPDTNIVRRCANLANQYHQDDPIRYPRDAKTAYIMDPKDLLRIQSEADAKGLEFVLIYHSHPDHDAYFSETDRELALFDGEPVWPRLQYLVVSVKHGKVSYFKVFRWDSSVKQFTGEPSAALQCND